MTLVEVCAFGRIRSSLFSKTCRSLEVHSTIRVHENSLRDFASGRLTEVSNMIDVRLNT